MLITCTGSLKTRINIPLHWINKEIHWLKMKKNWNVQTILQRFLKGGKYINIAKHDFIHRFIIKYLIWVSYRTICGKCFRFKCKPNHENDSYHEICFSLIQFAWKPRKKKINYNKMQKKKKKAKRLVYNILLLARVFFFWQAQNCNKWPRSASERFTTFNSWNADIMTQNCG